MNESTQREHTPDTPGAFGYCAWHKAHAEGVRLIAIHEQGSGPGGSLMACQPCRDVYGLIPLADRP